ncbi:MAG: nucleoside deaminase [Thermodesulfobacteriota bacterium]
MNVKSDEQFMLLALGQAREASRLNEVPVGAVIVSGEQQILSQAHNLRESTQNPVAHAEILAIEAACKKTGSWRLSDATIYITLEPCAMCMGAVVNSRIKRVVFGAPDPKAGAVVSNFGIGLDDTLNHRPEITRSVLEDECSLILKEFFGQLRNK